ncbi:MAG: dinitrogenase iron-molybdenum cofactor biosynthesis protein [Planctomycetes bacterium]|nr:dinitrogenase iron-molybdenum cofactor biosynthesis protein [Planctomycetota bacterium]MBM4078833.1 dinitrogenase iron-molybdenum cofactor biosynthesis protein [Planctomycetota bacterium]MBM4085312.1 dinitrogenase iron-molybdenum cofactor biosynthesis protein [Planctomycetota bacterium]
MRVALAVWNGRVSPVFDVARELMVVEVDGGREVSRLRQEIDGAALPQRAARVAELGVDVLVCGAISRPLAAMLAAEGIAVVPFVRGQVEEVLAAYLAGRLPDPRFLMPGCCGRRRRLGRRRQRCPSWP